MYIIILILIALGNLFSTSLFNEEFKQNHQAEINNATAIFNSGNYSFEDGGVVIDVDVNP